MSEGKTEAGRRKVGGKIEDKERKTEISSQKSEVGIWMDLCLLNLRMQRYEIYTNHAISVCELLFLFRKLSKVKGKGKVVWVITPGHIL
jgi:hypothetical protein